MAERTTTAAAGLRDFLYVDRDRVRSLLAQLDGGIVEEVVQADNVSGGGHAGARLLGLFDLRASLSRERSSQTTKSLEDALYFVFEEAAERQGLLSDLTDYPTADAWRSGALHGRIREAQLIRSHAPTRIIDAQLFRERTKRFVEWSAAAHRLFSSAALDDDTTTSGPGSWDEDEDLSYIADIGDVYGLMMADQISIRQFPRGPEEPDLCIAGTLLPRPEFLQEDREALSERMGPL